MTGMKQLGLGLNLSTKKTRKREFLDEMERVVPWAVLVQIVEPHYPKAKTGRPPFGIEVMLRIHYLQQWFGLSDPAMEEALHDMPLFREFARLDGATARLPDETTILRFRHLLEKHNLAVDMLRVVNDLLQRKGLMMRTGTVVDATLIAAPSSTKNAEGERDPEMRQTKKGNQLVLRHEGPHRRGCSVGPGAHVAGTAANVNDVTQAGCAAARRGRSGLR
jgi:IS5 family transposase